MKKAIFKTLGDLMAVSLLTSCASMPRLLKIRPRRNSKSAPDCCSEFGGAPDPVPGSINRRRCRDRRWCSGEAFTCEKNARGGVPSSNCARWWDKRLGKAAGHAVAVQQIQNLRNVQLKNQQTRGAFSEGSAIQLLHRHL